MPEGALESALATDKAVKLCFFRKPLPLSWFVSQLAFVAHMLMTKIELPEGWPDTLSSRGILAMISFGLVKSIPKCPKCGHETVLRYGSGRYHWSCSTSGHKHLMRSLNGSGFLASLRVSNWLAFLAFVNFLRSGERWLIICREMREGFGVCDEKVLRHWRHMYQWALKAFLTKHGWFMVGGRGYVVVIDESNLGAQKGIRKAMQKPRSMTRSRAAVRRRIAKTKPAQTLWKRGFVQKLSRFMKGMKLSMKRAKADARSCGLWLWAAVVVGKGDKVFTHGTKDKVFTFKLLPRKNQAPHGKPRGLVSIRETLEQRVKAKSKLVFDKWPSTVSAVKELGFDSAPPINHGQMFRDRATGFHSNDIESEFNRLKQWLRQRYSQLRLGGAFDTDDKNMDLEDGDLCEYMFYINVGSSMHDVMSAIADLNGGVYQRPRL